MSKLYDITVLGADDLDSWLTAAAFADQDLRVALILEQTPDPGLPGFFRLPLDPSRLIPLMEPFRLKPLADPHPPFFPDFQVIVAGAPVDVVSHPEHAARCLTRDLRELAPLFLETITELDKTGDRIIKEATEHGFPEILPPGRRDFRFFRLLRPAALWEPPPSPPFSQAMSHLPPLLQAVALGIANAASGAPLPSDVSFSQAAVLFLLARSLHQGPGAETDFREQAAMRIVKRGAVMEAVPDVIISAGRTLASLRLQGGAIMDTRVLFVSSQTAREKWRMELTRFPPPSRETEIQTTYFFKVERTTLPESLAARAVIIRDPQRPLRGDNLLFLVRSPRVPRRDTAAITLFSPPPELSADIIPDLLHSTLPWLEPKDFSPDDTRPPIISRIPAGFGLADVILPVFPLENLLPLPSEILPGWGHLGTALALQRLLPLGLDLIKKSRNRNLRS